jgi:Tfp pilus assembly protein FimT
VIEGKKIRQIRRERHEAGFTLIELILVFVTCCVVLTAAVPMFSSASRNSNADAAAQLIAQEISYARSLAIMNHASVLLQFTPQNNYIAVAPGTGSARGPFSLPVGIQILSSPLSPDTPDSLGSTLLGVGGYRDLLFLDNGTVVDEPSMQVCSGTVFLQHSSGMISTRRAVTLIGATGRVRVWHYDGTTGKWK